MFHDSHYVVAFVSDPSCMLARPLRAIVVVSGSHPVSLRVRFDELSSLFSASIKMKDSVFWDISACSPLKVNRRFGGTCRLRLQGRRMSQARN
jgi:hypothetical protein